MRKIKKFLSRFKNVFFSNLNSVFEIFKEIQKTNTMVVENGKKMVVESSGSVITIGSLVLLFSFVTILLLFIVKLFKHLRKENKIISIRKVFLLCLTVFGAGIAAAFLVKKDKLVSYFHYFFLRIFLQALRHEIGAGLFCGFWSVATLGYFFYSVLVPRFVFDNYEDSFFFEHHQKRVAAVTSFVMGQFLRFTWFYNPRLKEALFQRNWILLLFVVFFVLQSLWTHQTIVRNWRFLYPNDKRKRVVRRVLLLQLEFMANFFLQLLPSISSIERRNSLVRRVALSYLKGTGINILFLTSCFAGWFIGHFLFMIFYKKLLGLIVIITISVRNWLRKNFFES